MTLPPMLAAPGVGQPLGHPAEVDHARRPAGDLAIGVEVVSMRPCIFCIENPKEIYSVVCE
jgi:hypothetical protein